MLPSSSGSGQLDPEGPASVLATTSTAAPDEAIATFDGEFVWGIGTAPVHVEDKLDGGWLAFARDGNVAAWRSAPVPEERLRFWTAPETEIDLAVELGISVYRLGVDWGRLVPIHPETHGSGHVQDTAALARYVEIVTLVRQRGLRVMLTLFHHSLPKWALADGGWTSRSLVDYFITFSNDVLGALGADIEYLVTFNEPTIFIMLTHCSGIWPPGPKKSTAQGLQCLTPVVGDYARAIANIEAAHRAVYRSFSNTDLQIGVAHNVGFNVAEHVWDEAATAVAKALLKFSFIDSIKDSLDFCGLNYYGKEITRGGSVELGAPGAQLATSSPLDWSSVS